MSTSPNLHIRSVRGSNSFSVGGLRSLRPQDRNLRIEQTSKRSSATDGDLYRLPGSANVPGAAASFDAISDQASRDVLNDTNVSYHSEASAREASGYPMKGLTASAPQFALHAQTVSNNAPNNLDMQSSTPQTSNPTQGGAPFPDAYLYHSTRSHASPIEMSGTNSTLRHSSNQRDAYAGRLLSPRPGTPFMNQYPTSQPNQAPFQYDQFPHHGTIPPQRDISTRQVPGGRSSLTPETPQSILYPFLQGQDGRCGDVKSSAVNEGHNQSHVPYQGWYNAYGNLARRAVQRRFAAQILEP